MEKQPNRDRSHTHRGQTTPGSVQPGGNGPQFLPYALAEGLGVGGTVHQRA